MSTKKKIRKFKVKKQIKFDEFKNKSQELVELSKQLLIDLEQNQATKTNKNMKHC